MYWSWVTFVRFAVFNNIKNKKYKRNENRKRKEVSKQLREREVNEELKATSFLSFAAQSYAPRPVLYK